MNVSESRVGIRRWRGSREAAEWDHAAIEKPVELSVRCWFKDKQETRELGVLMRTPGHDSELVAGFLLSEGIITRESDIVEIRSGHEPVDPLAGVPVIVELSRQVDAEQVLQRSSQVSSSCGVCGRRGLPAPGAGVADLRGKVKASVLNGLDKKVRESQQDFSATGGIHAAALFTLEGQLQLVREDVGRHNAVDKVIGSQLLAGKLPLDDRLLFATSRSSFDLVQKALKARVPILATIGAPSTLAVEVAERYELTLVGFLREGRFNVYSSPWRVTP